MSRLIAFFRGKKCLGACTEKCYDSKKPTCDCICQGTNHGIGFQAADHHCQALLYLLMKNRDDLDDDLSITAVEYARNRYDLIHRTPFPLEET